ncbi:uncharacterized protein P174DRAFT_512989 [Aspergillus novofumigatus IBT 16806]|uniref:Ankyrin repeat protein n=1 Tax=Aspergillus novofumigatus (strain IBT 16806) TaxID=1392255 RepID=A0A2I1C442_ASPN1|nr:ankyrin repeat protein [Aspergillus novofumigatus IBT 16806]PKX92396.1 ankyrin repeat protein [Aspergillus novofumigatus IBT 16806]
MADPISILGLILQVVHTTKRVYEFAKQVNNADSEIRELFGELFALKAILEQMQTDHSEKNGTSTFRDALLKANTVLEEILDDLQRRTMRQSRLGKLGWPGRKGALEGNIAQLERLKTYFILVILNDRSAVEKETAHSIDAVVDWSREMRQLREEKTHEKIKTWICPVDFDSMHRKARSLCQAGTGAWFIHGPFQSWIAREGKCRLLSLEGKSGSGKTVLCSTAIDAVNNSISKRPSSTVIYYYCSFHLSSSQELVYLLGALLVQLSGTCPDILDELQESFKKRALPLPDVLIRLLLKYTKALSELFIVVDAINESSESAKILEALLTLLESSDNIRIMVTSTTSPPVSNPTISTLRAQMRPSTNRIDIEAFLNTQLQSAPALQRLPEHIKSRIKTVLLEKAGGMFRYVQCQIELLSAQKTGRDVIRALDSMPESLHGTYETILCRIPSYDREIARETLLWLSSGYQEITLSELSEALVVSKGDKSIDDDCRLFDPHAVLSICQGLVVYDERTTFVALAHSSVKAFLTSDAIKDGPAAYYSLDETEGSRRIWQKCLTYLMFDEFKQPCSNFDSLAERREAYPLLKYASENWASHCSPSWPPGYPLIDAEIDEILSFFETRHLPGGGNYTSWIQILLYEAPAEQARRTEPLYYAASYGILPLVDRLIKSGANVNAAGGRNDATPLIVACYRGQEATVQRLLEAGADPTIQDAAEMCSLEWAIRRQHRGIVESLLSHKRKSLEIGSSGLYWQCRACKHQNRIDSAVLRCASCGIDLLDQYGTRPGGSAPRKSAPRKSRAWSRIGRTIEANRKLLGNQVSSEP